MKIAWTTTERQEQAQILARTAVDKKFAACAQISGPISSIYCWMGETAQSEEYRITFKCSESQFPELEKHILSEHPYDVPQWIAVNASDVSEDYRRWAEG